MATDYYYRKSGQIPAFGDWENVNEMPITQYFECARQAGLLRCSCSGECGGAYANYAGDLTEKPVSRRVYAAPQKTRGMNKAYQHTKEQRKQVKVPVEQPRNQHFPHKHNSKHYDNNKPANLSAQRSSVNVKPVDEDLYKIPSELLGTSKRKKMLGFFSRCMVPPCAA